MNATVDRVSDDVAVIALDGELDASNYRGLIEQGRALYAKGVRRLVLDLALLTYMSSSGIVAMHSLAVVFRGQEPPDPEAGWAAFHAISAETSEGIAVDQIRIASPNAAIDSVLERTGLRRILPVFADRRAALAD